MSPLDVNEIKVFDDTSSNMDMLRTIISTENQENAFYIVDIGDIIKKHREWINKMPRVIPHFAIKCNPDPTVVKILAALNAGFECASEQEIKQVVQHGVQGNRIIFGNPTKCPSHIKFAKRMNVDQMTVDSEMELLKIKDLYPEAKIILRIRCDSKNSRVSLGSKFGCDPNKEAVRLIKLIKDFGLTLHGFSFHVGSPCGELNAFSRGIGICKRLIAVAKTMGCEYVQLIDIGGGFPGDSGTEIDKLANIINDAIQDLAPSIRVISEPGRYYVSSAFTLASYLHSKKVTYTGDKITKMYYINSGLYNSFMDKLMGMKFKLPKILFEPDNDEKFTSILWGPTCDSCDIILKDVLLPELHIGDWLVWENMGAYSLSISTTFNGFPIPMVIPVIRKSQWEKLTKEVKAIQKSVELTKWSDLMKRMNYVESR